MWPCAPAMADAIPSYGSSGVLNEGREWQVMIGLLFVSYIGSLYKMKEKVAILNERQKRFSFSSLLCRFLSKTVVFSVN